MPWVSSVNSTHPGRVRCLNTPKNAQNTHLPYNSQEVKIQSQVLFLGWGGGAPLNHHQMAQTTKIVNLATKDDNLEFLLIHIFSSFAVPCKTVGDRGLPCVFPFIYENTTYNSCTPRDSDNGQPWFVTASLNKLNVQRKIVLFLFDFKMLFLQPGARQQLTRRE